MLERFPHAKYLFIEHMEKDAPDNLKEVWRTRLRNLVWNTPEFADVAVMFDEEIEEEGARSGSVSTIGTHSKRKFAADYAANSGNLETWIEIRGRWKQKRGGKIVFLYIRHKKAYEDAKVCASLCIGGPVKYALKAGVDGSFTQQWLFDSVVPHTRRRFANDAQLCNVLGLAVLYACLSDEDDKIFAPDNLRNCVRSAYERLDLEETQPVEKIPLHIHLIVTGF
ncbi:hypothetical protein ACHAWF_008422 [Thalassiosira exigua]